jgi:hypothetical protein
MFFFFLPLDVSTLVVASAWSARDFVDASFAACCFDGDWGRVSSSSLTTEKDRDIDEDRFQNFPGSLYSWLK